MARTKNQGRKQKGQRRPVADMRDFVCSAPGCNQTCHKDKSMKSHMFNAGHFSDQLTAMMAQEVETSSYILEGPSAIAQAKEADMEILPWDFTSWMQRIRPDFDSPEAADAVERFLRGEEFTTVAALSRLQDQDLPIEWKSGRKRVLLTSTAEVTQEQPKAGSKTSKKRLRDTVAGVEYRCACGWVASHQNASKECHNHKFYKEHFSAAVRDLMQQETAACEVKNPPNSTADEKVATDKGDQEADECVGEAQDGEYGGGGELPEGDEEEDDEDDEDDRSKRRRAGDEAVDLRTFEKSVTVTDLDNHPQEEPKFV